ncbi:MAG: rod shape-determining protein MreC [Chthoniobacteraceae bacterium]
MNSRRANLIGICVFVAALAGVFILSPHNRQRIQSTFLGIVSPFLKKGSEVDSRYKGYRAGLKKLDELEAENQRLKVDNDQLRATNQALRGVESENIRLKSALGYQGSSPFTLVSARVIGRSPSNWWSTVIIDKGSQDLVQEEMPVVTPDGLVGKVVNLSEHSASVLLISDENCKVAGSVESSKEQGIVRVEVRGQRTSNSIQPTMTLNLLSRFAPLRAGQKVLTSGAGGIYPPGILIGQIVEFKSRELDGQAIIEPSVDIAALSDVFIITGTKGAAKAL